MCERELRDIDAISIVGFESEYLDGLAEVTTYRRENERFLVLFLGSTIGNFDRPAGLKFLAEVRRVLEPGDFLLLGTDLEKPAPQLLCAYDDELGVTGAFNLNLLTRINRELGANFDLRQFSHLAKINSAARSVEMHLRSNQRQRVKFPPPTSPLSSRKVKPSGPRAVISIHPWKSSRLHETPVSVARPSGSTPNGPLPRIFW